jgi:hypothetical protein
MRKKPLVTLLVFLVVAAMAVGLALPLASTVVLAQSAQRDLPDASVEPGAVFTVSIHAEDYGFAGQVVETLAAGFTYIGSSLAPGQVSVVGQVVTFTILGDEDFTYDVQAPMTTGVYSPAITGVLRDFEYPSNPVGHEFPITGEEDVTVEEAGPGHTYGVDVTANPTERTVGPGADAV